MSAKYRLTPVCLVLILNSSLLASMVLANPNGRGFLLPIISSKMLKSSTPTQALPSNVVAFMTAPSVPVDPIQEIAVLYNVDQYCAADIYETVGDHYANTVMVAVLCGVASPAALEELKGGVSC